LYFKTMDEKQMKWYVIHTYSGHENKVKTAIEKGLSGTPMEKM